jgi:hypothetical protein
MLIDSEAIIEFCLEIAKIHRDLKMKVLEASRTQDLVAYAYFEKREMMYQYEIPGVIKNLIEKEEDK